MLLTTDVSSYCSALLDPFHVWLRPGNDPEEIQRGLGNVIYLCKLHSPGLPPASLLKLEVSRTGRGFLLASILGSKSWSSVGLKKRGSVFCFGSVCMRVLTNVCSLSWYNCFPAIFDLTMWGASYPVLLKALFGGDPICTNGNLCLPFKCA